MSWMEEWRRKQDEQRAARRAARFNADASMSAGSALEDLRLVVIQQEQKYAGRWGFLDSLANMGRNNGRPKEISPSLDSQRQREETGARGTDSPRDAEGPEQVA